MSRILLVTHEASRSGAPRVAQLAAKCLIAQSHDVRIVSRRAGPLLAEFARVAPTLIEPFWRVRRRLWDLPGSIGKALARCVDMAGALALLLWTRPDLVYVNSASAAIYVAPARLLRMAVVFHIHESSEIFRFFLDRAGITQIPRGVVLVACSPSVARDLETLQSGPSILLPSIPDAAEVAARSKEIPDHDYAEGEIVVGCCGRVEHRKGADLWIEACRRVRQALPQLPLRFIWVGDGIPPKEAATVPGLTFVGPSDNPYAHIERFTVATLPSRDDPFPLVVMEAMLLGKPIVAFAVGSVPSQISQAGILVEPNDVKQFAEGIVQVLSNDDLRSKLGKHAQTRAQSEFSLAGFSTRLAQIVEGALVATAAAPGSSAKIRSEAHT